MFKGNNFLLQDSGVTAEDAAFILTKIQKARLNSSIHLVLLLDECKADYHCSCGAKNREALPTCYEDEDGE